MTLRLVVSLVIELGEAEIVLGGSFIRGEASDGIARISDDGVAEAGLETGENGGAMRVILELPGPFLSLAIVMWLILLMPETTEFGPVGPMKV